MKKFTILLMLALLFGTVWARNTGDVYHEVQVIDEVGNPVTDITSLYIYLPDSTTNATIYMDADRQNAITLPMTESSTNTTLVDGYFSWWGPDGWNFSMTNANGVGPATNSGHAARTSSEGRLVFPSYLASTSTTAYEDDETATFGTGADWVINGASAVLSFTPGADNSAFNIGVSGTSLNSDFNVYVGTALGLKLDAGNPSLTWDGGAVLLNYNSNYNVGINTGTSTGITSIGSATAGGVAIDTDAGITVNADDSYALTVSAGTIGIAATGGDITIDGTDSSVIIRGSEAAADAIVIEADTALGGIDITSNADIDITTTGAAGEDITIANTDGSVNITASEADAGAILIQASAAGGDVNIDSVLGRIEIEAEEDAADAIYIIADGGTSSTLTLFNDTGTAADSIELLTDVGGITATASAGAIVATATGATAGDVTISAGDVMTLTHVDTLIFDGAATETWVIEGTANEHETTVTFTDPTADRTISFPDGSASLGWIASAGTTTKDASNAAIPLTDAVVVGTSGAASAWSLANGEDGQILTVVIGTDGGEATITPATATGWATAVLTDDIDTITFMYVNDTVGWIVLGTAGDGTNLVALTQ